MSVESVMARIAELQTALAPRPKESTADFSAVLGAQTSSATPAGMGALTTQTGWNAGAAGGSAGQKMLQLASAEIGQTEQPPGSNDSQRISQYRTATAGSGVGPWCAYFVSWAAKEAGAPLGEQGQGFGAVAAVWDWAQRTGRTVQQPQPGDLIVWDGRHIGIVEKVDPQGNIHTIEGNSSNMVTRRQYGPDGGGATGYVRPG
jgi:uncharacterized protein (TIGR02594 family)